MWTRSPRVSVAVFSFVVLAAGCGSSDSRAPGMQAEGCLPPCSDAATHDSSQKDAVDEPLVEAGAEGPEDATEDPPWTGATATVSGKAFISNPPDFPANATSEYPLYYDATIKVLTSSSAVSIPSTGGSGFSGDGVPVGRWPVVVEDIAEKNGIYPTLVHLVVDEGGSNWTVPAAAKNAFTIIYQALASPLYVDAFRAQIILTFEACPAAGSGRLPGVVVDAPSGSEGVVYNAEGSTGWVHESPAGTGPNGTAIVVNLPTVDLPGEDIAIGYTVAGTTYTTAPFRVAVGVVTRVPVVQPCP